MKMVFSCKMFTLNEANVNVALQNACRRSVRALYFSVITTIMDHKLQLTPMNKRELYTYQVAEPYKIYVCILYSEHENLKKISGS
jgi:hypothetical protein